MLRFAADENFNNNILRGVERRHPDVDVVRIQDSPVSGGSDPEVLQWAADESRVVLTQDVNTMPFFANQRVKAGLRMPGIILVPQSCSMSEAIEDLALIATCSSTDELENVQVYLPLK